MLANKAMSLGLGVHVKDIIGAYCPKLMHGLNHAFPGCPLEEAVEKNNQAVEKELYDSENRRWFKSAVYPTGRTTANGEPIFLHTVLDITAQKLAEEELKRSNATQIAINSLLCLSLEDLTLNEFLGKSLDIILSIPWLTLESKGSLFLVEDEPGFLIMKAQSGLAEPVRQACARVRFGTCLCGRAALKQEVEFAGCLDERHTVEYEGMVSHGHYCVPIIFSGKVLGVINTYLKEGHANNTNEREFLTAVANALAGVIARRQSEQAKQRMEEKIRINDRMAAVGEMTAGIAHEINNPLTGVIGFSEILSERQDLPSEVMEELKIIADGSNRVKDIVKRMLAFARQTKPVRASVSINELIDATLGLRSYVLRTANIEVIKHLDPDLPWIVVDPGQMQQVFLNLIVNAEYAMKEAHGKGILTISSEKLIDCIRLTFQDDGPGISKENKTRLFESFFTTKAAGEGTGLGLSLSHSIIREHGGKMRVESEPGQGAAFIIELPMIDGDNSTDV